MSKYAFILIIFVQPSIFKYFKFKHRFRGEIMNRISIIFFFRELINFNHGGAKRRTMPEVGQLPEHPHRHLRPAEAVRGLRGRDAFCGREESEMS